MLQEMKDHLASGSTQLCLCWSMERLDGSVLGFTDHDRDLSFDGVTYHASSGLSASALESVSGMAVDNSEVFGALSTDRITEADIDAGLFDGAAVTIWQVRWDRVSTRHVIFRGSIGEISRSDGGFRAELRSLGELLNIERESLFQSQCSTILGGTRCGVDVSNASFTCAASLEGVDPGPVLRVVGADQYPARWFDNGSILFPGERLNIKPLDIREDLLASGARLVSLWQTPVFDLMPGQDVTLIAGCDRRFSTCRDKFQNAVNFRGHPHLPGNDWIMATPRRGQVNDGGSMNS